VNLTDITTVETASLSGARSVSVTHVCVCVCLCMCVCVCARTCMTVYLSVCAGVYRVVVGSDQEEYTLERYMQDEALDRHAWTGSKFS
jgi:hypothetical protein